MFKRLETKDNHSDKDKEIIYRSGKIIKITDTPNNHLMIICNNVKRVSFLDGCRYLSTFWDNDFEMNFMIPKRRDKLMKTARNDLIVGEKYIFKLQKESKSKKYCISEIFS